MKERSVFIDESGDFGEIKERPAYYLVTFVFHNFEKILKKFKLKLLCYLTTAHAVDILKIVKNKK